MLWTKTAVLFLNDLALIVSKHNILGCEVEAVMTLLNEGIEIQLQALLWPDGLFWRDDMNDEILKQRPML
jgi:hypothetical protein